MRKSRQKHAINAENPWFLSENDDFLASNEYVNYPRESDEANKVQPVDSSFLLDTSPMPYSNAIRTLLITSFTLLACNSIVCGQEYASTVIEGQFETSTNVASTETREARPGERVSNPAHAILNSDTTLGGVAVTGPNPTDHGYLGPGDMRTHLWNGHSQELIANGLTENKVMAMSVEEAQKWHNHFHGAEGSPEHDDGFQEQNHYTVVAPEPATPAYSTYVPASVYGSTVYENPVIDNSGYPQPAYDQPVYSQPEIIYGQGVIVDGATSFGYSTDYIGQ